MNKLFFILFFLTFSLVSKGQDPQYSQFYAAPLYLAPSFAGGTEGSRVIINYRNQWQQVPGAFNTYSLSYDHYIPNVRSGVGFLFMRDQAGSGKLNTTNAGFQYSYSIPINRKWEVRPGIHFLFAQRGINFNKLVFGDQIVYNSQTSVEIPSDKKVNYFDFSASGLAYSDRNWIGASFDHLLKPNQSLTGNSSKIPLKYSVFGGTKFAINGRFGKYDEETISLAFHFKSQAEYDQLDLGIYWAKRPLVIGVWYRGLPLIKDYENKYRNQDAFVVLAGYQLEDLKIGYSYDFTISHLASNTGGSHEISIIFEFWQDQKVRKKRKRVVVSCPKF